MYHTIMVKAFWDAEASVWVATSSDVEGLCVEADTFEDLDRKIKVIIPELIELNGFCSDLDEIPVHLFAENNFRVANTKSN